MKNIIGTMKKNNGMVLWSLIGIILLASLPLLTNYSTYGTELAFHLNRIETMKSALSQGGFLVKEGSLYLLIPALFGMLGMPVQTSYKLFLFLVIVGTVILSYVSFAKIFQDKVIGILGCLLYTWAPYHFSILYCSASLGESVAYAFLPLVLWGVYDIYVSEDKAKIANRTWIVLALGYTGMVQANVLSFLVTAAFTLLVCVIRWKKTCKVQTLLAFGKVVLCFGIVNSWYLLALFKGIRAGLGSAHFYVGGMIQEKGVYLAHYLLPFFFGGHSQSFQESGMIESAPLGIGFALTVSVLGYLWMLFTGKTKENGKNAVMKFAGTMAVVGGIVLFMSTNSFPWDFLRVYNGLFAFLTNLLQAPAKLMTLVIVAATFVACAVAAHWKMRARKYFNCVVAIIIGISIITSQYLVGDIISSNERMDIISVEQIPALENVGTEYLP